MDDFIDLSDGFCGLDALQDSIQEPPNVVYDLDLVNMLLDDLPDFESVIEEKPLVSFSSESPSSSFAFSPSPSSSNDELSLLSHQSFKFFEPTKKKEIIKEKILCPVCLDGDAGHHKHYGGKACISCRAFFRRSVHNDAYQTFACNNIATNDSEMKPCNINSKSWGSCRYCRFEQCLASGLKISLVLKPNQRTSRNKESFKMAGTLKHITPSPNGNFLSTTGFTNSEVLVICNRAAHFQFDHLRKEMMRFFVENPSSFETLQKMYHKKHSEVGIVDVGNAQIFGLWFQNIFRHYMCTTYEDHNALGQETLHILDNYNIGSVYFFNSVVSIGNAIVPSPLKEILECVYQHQRYLSRSSSFSESSSQDEMSLGGLDEILIEPENPNYFISIMARRAMKQNIEANPPDKAIDFDQAYPAEMWNDDTKKWEAIIRKNIHDVAKWPTFVNQSGDCKSTKNQQYKKKNGTRSNRNVGTMQKNGTKRLNSTEVKVDYVLLHLLSIVALYSLDSCREIINSKTVESLQIKYLHLLHQYLAFRYPSDAYVRLASGMQLISKAKESCEILRVIS